MTEFIALLLLSAIAAVAAVIWAYYRYAARELQRLQEYEFFCSKFFAASDALINDAETPDVVINVLAALNSIIADEKASKQFLNGYEAYCLQARRENRPRLPRPEMNEFMKRRGELGKQFADAAMSGIMAMTFLGNGWGVKARAMLADAFAREPKPSEVIEVIEHNCMPQAA